MISDAVITRPGPHLLHHGLGALVLYVSLGRGEQGAHRVHVDAALDEAGAGATQLVQTVVVGRVHQTWGTRTETNRHRIAVPNRAYCLHLLAYN